MKSNALFGVTAMTVALAAALHPASARADGPVSAYENGGKDDPSLDPGEEQMTADEENQARQKDLSAAYHSGYSARAKEDAETYSALREQLRRHAATAAQGTSPPLPPGLPPNGGQVTQVAQPQIAQRPLDQSGYQWQAAPVQYAPPPPQYAQQPQYAPPPQYALPPGYAQVPAYSEPPPEYAPAYVQQVYEPPPPPVQYVPVVQPAYVAAPVLAVAAAFAGGFRGYGYGGPVMGYRGGWGRWR